MPSVTEKQREAMAIAEHHPEQLYKKNRGMLKMSHQQLHEFASSVEGKRSTHGSKPYTLAELKRGYRVVKCK